jgi:hypothetical protein
VLREKLVLPILDLTALAPCHTLCSLHQEIFQCQVLLAAKLFLPESGML